MRLETERLVLRHWKDSDAEGLYEYAKDPEVGPSAGWLPHKSAEDSLFVIRNVLCGEECYAVCEKGTDRAIGSIELIPNGGRSGEKREDACELGYWLARDFWGRGYIPEAGRELLRRAFEDLNMREVWCCYFDGNGKSRRVQEKLGFRYQRTERDVSVPMLGEIRTEHLNRMTKAEWEESLAAEKTRSADGTYDTLKEFWNDTLTLTEEDRTVLEKEGIGEPETLAPSEKHCRAIAALADRASFLDYGCGCGWASILACRAGIPSVTGVDLSPNAVEAAKVYASLAGADRAKFLAVGDNWLRMQPSESVEVFFCSNVIDVVPPAVSAEIIREAARITAENGTAIFSLNYALTPEKPGPADAEVRDGCLYVNGVLRLVSRTDEEWRAAFEPYFTVEKLEHFAWPGEDAERRRLFFLKKKTTGVRRVF